MKTIVAATDFSVPSAQAVARAALLARAHRATLHLLHVPSYGQWSQGTGMFSDWFGDGNAPSLDSDRERLALIAEDVGKRHRLRPECHVVPGKAADEIAAFVVAREVDLVVLAARGIGGVRLRSVGSTALKVLWNSLVPVLMVRTPADDAYRRLLVATDLGERAAHVVERARETCPKATLTLLHAFRGEFETALSLVGATPESLKLYRAEEAQAAAARLEAHWKAIRGGTRRKAERYLAHGHPVPAVLKAAAELEADLVALGKHSGPRWEEKVIGSVVQNLVQQLRTDVLIVP